MIRARVAFALLLSIVAVATAGCVQRASIPGTIPTGISVSVFQYRLDYSPRILEMEVTNSTDATITVTDASFVSTRFVSAPQWTYPEKIPSGAARDLRVQLPAPLCGSIPPRDAVSLSITLGNGAKVAGAIVPTDSGGSIDAINNEDCLNMSAAAIATIAPPSTVLWTHGAHQPATLNLTVTPTGASGKLTITYVSGTVLLGLIDSTGAQVYDIERDQVVDASSGVSVIPLLIVPGRCDAHAIAEDKRGTFIPLQIQTGDGRAGKIYIAMPDDVRRGIYEYYQDYCGFGG